MISLFKYVFWIVVVSLHTVGFANIWEQTRNSIQSKKSFLSYESVVQYMDLLMTPEGITQDENDVIVIGNGHIMLSPESIKSFKNIGDVDPEFEYKFAEHVPQNNERTKREDLEGIRIALDVVKVNQYFTNTLVGQMPYEQFVEVLQQSLARHLQAAGAEITFLRPKIALSAKVMDSMNDYPPHIVMSPQFNNDNQDDMVTFCAGNILPEELKSETNRARFIEAALTGKHISSVLLGACITKHCQDELGVGTLSWKKASFEGNARPINGKKFLGAINLDIKEKNFNGIMTRNLLHNRIFAQAVVNPFPDMHWIRKQIVSGQELDWIEKYTNMLSDAVIDYVKMRAADF